MPSGKKEQLELRDEPERSPALTDTPFLSVRWTQTHLYVLLSLATILLFAPFSTRAFHVDDTLFLRTAQNIVKHPFDPYGFQITWDWGPQQMSEVTQNPPLASYFLALVGITFGWSERALHLGFLPVTVLLILGTYKLASKFTGQPALAALATLLTPGVLVSASSVMCDTMMLALWVWASIFWIDGFEDNNHYLLATAAFLIAASALTKYFGISLFPLLLTYSLWRRRRVGIWFCYLLIPIAILIAYQGFTERLYGHGLLLGAGQFASTQRAHGGASLTAMAIIGLSFAGGCGLSAVFFAPLLWHRTVSRYIALGSAIASLLIVLGWVNVGLQVGGSYERRESWLLVDAQLALFIAGGISILVLAITDYQERRDAASAFLALWVVGTFAFAAFVNYTVNARSVLPLIPGAGILIARRVEKRYAALPRTKIAIALLLSAAVSLLVAGADASLANSARRAAILIVAKTSPRAGALWFEGHWGFQYYMEQAGAVALNMRQPQLRPGDFVALPSNNIQTRNLNPKWIVSREQFELDLNGWAATIDPKHRAGFYSAYWGPLPYVIVRPPVESYEILKIADVARSE